MPRLVKCAPRRHCRGDPIENQVMMRLLAFSDLHLDAPFAGRGPRMARLRRAELRDTLSRIVRLAKELSVDALMCAGDLYEHELYTPDTVQMLQRLFSEAAPIPVLISPGNHDWFGPGSIYVTADWSPNVHIFGTGDLQPYDGLDGVRVWGFAHRNPSSTTIPLDRFRARGSGLHLGLLHGSELGGWAKMAESEPEKIRHAPFRADSITRAGLAHCIVGHYHSPFMGDSHTYPGAPAPLSFKDRGRGGAVEIAFDERGRMVERNLHRVTNLEVHDLALDVSGCVDLGEIQNRLDTLLKSRQGIARVTVGGELGSAVELDLSVLNHRRGTLQDLEVRAGSMYPGYDVATIRKEPTVRGAFVRDVMAADLDEEERHRVIITGLRALEGRKDLAVS